jgi:DNA invertase Pin-like site-specific DNA recombinase
MLIGYARVSTNEQDTAAQVAALKAAGCERIYRENSSGGRWDRPELHRLVTPGCQFARVALLLAR